MGMQGLEHRLERMVEGVFRRSRNSIRPIELGRRLIREMDDHRSVDVKGQRIAPNDFVVLLSADDHAGFADIEQALRTELVEACREYAREEGYHFMGPVSVELQIDNSLRPGRFGIVAALKEPDPGHQPGAIVMPSGDRIELDGDTHTIGRLSDCTVVITDGNTSRHHARLARAGSGWSISDLNSTNGTYVNGARIVAEHRLADGDIITVGSVSLRFDAS
jgi:FhaA, N-terminal domain/FHA domain